MTSFINTAKSIKKSPSGTSLINCLVKVYTFCTSKSLIPGGAQIKYFRCQLSMIFSPSLPESIHDFKNTIPQSNIVLASFINYRYPRYITTNQQSSLYFLKKLLTDNEEDERRVLSVFSHCSLLYSPSMGDSSILLTSGTKQHCHSCNIC